jgi:hypothetical protein
MTVPISRPFPSTQPVPNFNIYATPPPFATPNRTRNLKHRTRGGSGPTRNFCVTVHESAVEITYGSEYFHRKAGKGGLPPHFSPFHDSRFRHSPIKIFRSRQTSSSQQGPKSSIFSPAMDVIIGPCLRVFLFGFIILPYCIFQSIYSFDSFLVLIVTDKA